MLGSPEGELAIAQACLYCATAPKSNAAYVADKAARKLVESSGSLSPPAAILNAPTTMMKSAGYGAGYVYDHDTEHGFSGQDYWPEALPGQTLYVPTDRGFERRIGERMAWWKDLRSTLRRGES